MTTGWLLPAIVVLATAASICGACLPLPHRTRWMSVFTVGASLAALAGSASVFHTGRPIDFRSAQIIPATGVSLVLDSLGALFTATIAVVAACAAVFAAGYRGHGLSSRTASSIFPVFVASMLLVPAAATVTTFLYLWELMAITSLFLVLAGHRHSEAVHSAGQWYAVMTQAGAAAILVGLVLLATHAGGQSFEAVRHHARGISPAIASGAFVLAVIGFGSKSGAVPLHVWLPRAHPEAPGPVSALMSAGMVNLGIYGILRVGMWMLGGGPVWWWALLMGIGAASALFGALHSATDSDIKRLLAYSTTDNIGLVLIGIGASGVLSSTGHRTLGELALVAALLHMVFHAGFKGSLFLAAGSIQQATGTKDLDLLGGLLRAMPVTGALFLVGGLAISALPPLSGFVSEWLLLQSMIHGLPSANVYVAVAMPIGVAVLALAGGVTAVTFVKAIGIGLLGRARSEGAEAAREVSASMWVPTGILGAFSVVFGVAPLLVIPLVISAAGKATSSHVPAVLSHGWRIGLPGVHGVIVPALFGAGMVAVMIAAGATRSLLQRGAVRVAEPWACGREALTARMQYTATSYAEPLVRVFDDVIRPSQDVDVSHAAESRYYVEAIAVHASHEDAFERHVYRPIGSLIHWWGEATRKIQNGSVHRYLAFGMVALIVVLVVVA